MDIFIDQSVKALASAGVRLDSNETAFLERQLTQLRTKTYDVVYGELLGRSMAPKATDIASSANRYSYEVFDKTGAAKIGGNGVDDPPRIDLEAREVFGDVYPLIASYGWDINAMREAIRTRVPLADKKARACRDAIELAIDDMIFLGRPEPDAGAASSILTTGIANNAAVEAQGAVALTNWTLSTPVDTIQSEIYSLLTAIRNNSLQVFNGTVLGLPLAKYDVIAQLPVGVDNQTTILQSILQNSPFLQSIVPWYKLNNQGANGTGRAIAFQRDSNVLEAVIPQEFEQLPPQARNYEFVVPCHARCGGIKVYQPNGMIYGDFGA